MPFFPAWGEKKTGRQRAAIRAHREDDQHHKGEEGRKLPAADPGRRAPPTVSLGSRISKAGSHSLSPCLFILWGIASCLRVSVSSTVKWANNAYLVRFAQPNTGGIALTLQQKQ